MFCLRLGSRKISKYSLPVRQSQYFLRYYSDEKPNDANLYDSLGIKSSASPAEIKQAYYDLSFKYHPDRNKDSVEASDKFREVTEAYEVLGNYGLRKRYDKGLPLPNRKSKFERQPIVETPVQYQSFFDSRTGSQKNKSKFQGIGTEDDMSDLAGGKNMSHKAKMIEDKFKQSASLSWLICFFLLSLMLIVRLTKD